jgi:hypothetical protein
MFESHSATSHIVPLQEVQGQATGNTLRAALPNSYCSRCEEKSGDFTILEVRGKNYGQVKQPVQWKSYIKE